MINKPNGEQPLDFNKINKINERWVYFALGYLSGITVGIIMIYIMSK